MLKQVAIKNFQSHADTVLELHPGVNSLQGNSDSGKTSVLRALRWCMENDGKGLADVSYWATTPKGEVSVGKECSVTITTDVSEVCRARAAKFNGYRVNRGGEASVYEALRTDVPVSVAREFNISDVNEQWQTDGPFFLSDRWTPGERARYINQLVDLSEIDAAMSACNSLSSQATSRRKAHEESLHGLNARLDVLSVMDELPAIDKAIADAEETLRSCEGTVNTLGVEMFNYEKMDGIVKSVGTLLQDLDSVLSNLQSAEDEARRLRESTLGDEIAEYERLQSAIAIADDVDALSVLINAVSVSMSESDELRMKCKELGEAIIDYGHHIGAASASGMVAELDAIVAATADLSKSEANAMSEDRSLSASIDEVETLEGVVRESELAYEDAVAELSTMACPMCGHIGCAC